MTLLGRGYERREVKIRVRPGHEVHAVFLNQFLLDPLGHAADDSDNLRMAGFASQRVEGLKAGEDFLFRIVADGACIQEYGVGEVNGVGLLIAGHFHDCSDHFAVGHVHLTSVGFNQKFFHTAQSYAFLARKANEGGKTRAAHSVR